MVPRRAGFRGAAIAAFQRWYSRKARGDDSHTYSVAGRGGYTVGADERFSALGIRIGINYVVYSMTH
jgi:hypothetical protein